MNSFLKGVKTFLSILFSILLVMLLIIIALTVNISGFFKEGNVNKIARDINITDIVKSDKKTWDNIRNGAKEYGLEDDALSNIIDGENIKVIFSKYFASMVDVGINDVELIQVTKEEVSEAISKDIDIYNKNNDRSIDNNTKANILNFVENNYNELESSFPTKEEIIEYFNDDDLKKVKSFINTLKEMHFAIWLIGISLLLILLILAFKFEYYKFLKYYGISFLIAGISVLLAGIILLLLDSLILEIDADKVVIDMMLVIKNNVASNLNITAIILIVISIFLFFIKKGLGSYGKPIVENNVPIMNEVEKAMVENQEHINNKIEE